MKLKQNSVGAQGSYKTFNQLEHVERKTPLIKLVVILKQNENEGMTTCPHVQKQGLA